MPTAYSYIRFSTPEQRKGDSLRRQLESTEAYAFEHGLTLDQTLTFRDLGVSAFDGSNISRGALRLFLDAVQDGLVARGSYLLVESLDRLSRDRTQSALALFLSIVQNGITIVTLADKKVFSEPVDTFQLIESILIMSRAHEESMIKSTRGRAAWANKRNLIDQRKLTARCPLWMTMNAERTSFELIPDRSDVVREMIALAKNGMGQSAIAKLLNQRSVPNFSSNPNGWYSSYIQKILTSPALYGELQPHITRDGKSKPQGDPVPNYYPALISKEEFFQLRAYRSQNAVGGGKARKGNSTPNLLSGLLKCGYCGGSMVIAGSAKTRAVTPGEPKAMRILKRVLVCDAGRRGKGCYAVQWNHEDFETSFLSFCIGLDFEHLLQDSGNIPPRDPVRLLEDRRDGLDNQVRDITEKINVLLGFIESGQSSEAVKERLKAREAELASLKVDRDQCEMDIQKARADEIDVSRASESTRSAIELLHTIDESDRLRVRSGLAALLRRMIKSVVLHPAGRLVSKEFLKEQRSNMVRAGIPETEVEVYIINAYRTEPLRQGRSGRGQYSSRKDLGRFFVIQTKNGGTRVVYPNFDDPTKALVNAGIGDA